MTPFDENGLFHPASGGEGLRRLALRGAGITVFSQTLGFVIQMVGTVILARLLTPDDFGLLIMVTTFSLLLMNVGLNGCTEAVLQREQIDHLLASNLFWINAGLGLVFTFGFAAVAPLLARFYGEPRVAGVAEAVAVTIFFTSLSVQHLALLKRAMRFFEVALNDIVARTVSVLVSVVLAFMGWGYWALVAGAVTLPLVTSVGAWVLCRWVPGPPQRGVGTIPMIRFAIHTYGHFVMDYISRNMDNLLIGWRLGPQPLGFYKKAYDLFILPANQLSAPLTVVAVSTLSRLTGDSAQQRRYFLSALSTLAFIGMGLGACLTLVGKDLIFVLLGPKWEESGRLFTFFGPGIGIMLLYGTHGWIHLSLGRPDRWFRWGIVEVAVTGLLFLLALPWGPAGIAVAWVVSYGVLVIPGLWYAGKPAGLGVAPVVRVVWKFVFASALAGLASAAILRGFSSLAVPPESIAVIGRILVVSGLFLVLYLSAVVLLHGGAEPVSHVAELVKVMVLRRRESPLPRGATARLSSSERQTLA